MTLPARDNGRVPRPTAVLGTSSLAGGGPSGKSWLVQMLVVILFGVALAGLVTVLNSSPTLASGEDGRCVHVRLPGERRCPPGSVCERTWNRYFHRYALRCLPADGHGPSRRPRPPHVS